MKSRVFLTACYSSRDAWRDQNNAAIDAVAEDSRRQGEVNAGLEQRYPDPPCRTETYCQ